MDTRLKEVRQTDLTEGRVNQDFVDWLQTKGMSWLLVLLVFLCVYFIFIRWRNHQHNYQVDAWRELATASLPGSFEDVADKYATVGSISDLARLRAGELLLNAVQAGKALGAANEAQRDLTEVERADYLDRADKNYTKVLETDDGSMAKALIAVTALTGRATVAEARGDLEVAITNHKRAAERAKDAYPILSQQAQRRAESVAQNAAPVVLPTNAQVTAAIMQQPQTNNADAVSVDPWARDLIMPKDGS